MKKFKKNHFHNRILTEELQLSNRKYTKREYRDRYFFPDEWKAFFDQLKKKQKITFHFLICTGARINEARHVKVKDVDHERNNIVFRWTKSRNKDGSRKMRTIPISPQFSKYLKKIEREYELGLDDYFPILSTPAASIAMKGNPTTGTPGALQKAGIPDWKMFSVHNVRKTLEMFLTAWEVPEGKILKHMSHSSKVSQKYYVSPEIFNWEDKQDMREIVGDLYRR